MASRKKNSKHSSDNSGSSDSSAASYETVDLPPLKKSSPVVAVIKQKKSSPVVVTKVTKTKKLSTEKKKSSPVHVTRVEKKTPKRSPKKSSPGFELVEVVSAQPMSEIDYLTKSSSGSKHASELAREIEYVAKATRDTEEYDESMRILLNKKGLLDDNVINAFADWLNRQQDNVNLVYMTNVFFITTLVKNLDQPQKADGYTRRANPQCRMFLVPVNMKGNHWVLFSVFVPQQEQPLIIRVYDSLTHPSSRKFYRDTSAILSAYFSHRFGLPGQEKVVPEIVEVRQQPNGVDCGVHTCMRALYIATAKDPWIDTKTDADNLKSWRKWIYDKIK